MTNLRRYWYWVAALAGVEVLSWTAFRLARNTDYEPNAMTVVIGLVIVAALWLAIKKPHWLAWATLIELIIGGKGYLLWGEVGGEKISIRLALFVIIMLAAVVDSVRQKKFTFPRPILWPVGLLLGWVGVMSVVGVMRGYGVSGVFTDMNAYLYIAMMWPWWLFLRRSADWKNTLFIVLLSGVTIVGFKSWVIQLLFAQNIPQTTTLYHWIRQTGIGEITLISKNVYRIFFQSQIYALIGFVLLMVGYIRQRHQPWWGIAALGSSLGVYLSLSRSLWLGLAVALGVFALVEVSRKNWPGLRRFFILIPLAVFVWMMTTWALNFPYIVTPPGRQSNADAVVARLKSAGSTQASTARANQIPPLVKAIGRNPISGHGFGATLTYYSTDPRIRGARTTSAFELGYLDMAFHIGLIGLGLFGWWLWLVWKKIRYQPDAVLWIWPTIAIATVHLTSPYLNHPLGLGWLALISIVAFDHD